MQWDVCVGDSAGAHCLQEAPWVWYHPTSPRRDGIWHAAGHRVQLLARTWPSVNCSWAAPACAHSSTSSQHGRAGGLRMMLPNPSLRLKHCWHSSGVWGTSRGPQLTVVCSWAQGACRATTGPLQCRHTRDRLIPTSHRDGKALKGFLLAINHLQAVGREK